MSWVTNVILAVPLSETIGCSDLIPAVNVINQWLEENHQGRLISVDQHAGGKKVMEAKVFLLAANGLQYERFIEVVKTAGWDEPGDVGLFIKDQEQPRFEAMQLGEPR